MKAFFPNRAFRSEAEAFLAEHPGTLFAEAIFADMNGIVRGKQIPVKALTSLGDKGVNYPLSTLVLDCQGRMVADALKDGLDGDPDRTFYPVSGSLQPMPWAERPSAQVLMAASESDGSALFCDPRAVLQRAWGFLRAAGLTPVIAIELEFFLLDPASLPPTPVKPLDATATIPGRALRVAFRSLGGWTHEDGLVISKSGAAALRRHETREVRFRIPATVSRLELVPIVNQSVRRDEALARIRRPSVCRRASRGNTQECVPAEEPPCNARGTRRPWLADPARGTAGRRRG